MISGACLHSGFLCVSTGLSFFAVMGTPGPGGTTAPRARTQKDVGAEDHSVLPCALAVCVMPKLGRVPKLEWAGLVFTRGARCREERF